MLHVMLFLFRFCFLSREKKTVKEGERVKAQVDDCVGLEGSRMMAFVLCVFFPPVIALPCQS